MNTTMTNEPDYLILQKRKASRMVLWILIVSIIMLFGGLTSAYIVRQAEGNWTHFELPVQFFISTIIILFSSAAMHWSYLSLKKNNKPVFISSLIVTLGLGLLFAFFQFLGWSEMVRMKLFLVADNPSTSFVYAITGLHLAHLLGGLIALVVCTTKAIMDRYSPQNNLGIVQCAVYWHFLGLLWVYLFLFFKFFN